MTDIVQRRKREPVSCKRCRERKEKCDRNRAGCSNCKKRRKECIWYTSSNASSPLPLSHTTVSTPRNGIRTPQDQRHLLSISHFPLSPPDSVQDHTPNRCCRLADQICSQLPSKEQGRRLLHHFIDVPLTLWHCVDPNELLQSFEDDWQALQASPRRHTAEQTRCAISFDTIARLLVIFAATSELLPKTYLISLGIAKDSKTAHEKIMAWIGSYLECYQYCTDNDESGIGVLQSVFLFNAVLSDKISKNKQLSLLDAALRSARSMGLDRLSSAEEDKRYWATHGLQEGLQLATHTAQRRGRLSWSVARLYAGDCQAREYGRAIWSGLVMIGSVVPGTACWRATTSVDTQMPGTLPFDSEGDGEETNPFLIWHLIGELSSLLYEWTQIREDCQAHGLGPDFTRAIRLHDRVNDTLERWGGTDPLLELDIHRFESESDFSYEQRKIKILQRAWCTFCILAKKLMVHRPFLTVAYRSGQRMSGLVDDTVQCALDLIKGARNITNAYGWIPMNSSLAKHALMQSALVLILDLFFRPDRLDEQNEGAQKQDSLHFVISLLKENSTHYTPVSLLYDAGNKLELLLSFCAKHCQERLQMSALRSSTERAPDRDEEEVALDQLDDQLKGFGRVIWFFAETDSLLDTSSISMAPSMSAATSSADSTGAPFTSSQQRTEWERIWQDFFGSLEVEQSQSGT